MNREEIENRILLCELKANGYREADNVKSAERYDNEKHKWEKLLSDLDLLNERKITELLEYKKGYFNLQQENKQIEEQLQQRDEVIEEAINYITSEEYFELNNYMSISESQNRANYFKAHDKLLDILNKYKGDNNE